MYKGNIKNEKSGNIAKDRLKLLLISDRASCSPEIIDSIKSDMVHTISKYIEIDEESVDITIHNDNKDIHKGAFLKCIAPIKEVRNK